MGHVHPGAATDQRSCGHGAAERIQDLEGQLDAIEKGIQVALFDQRWPDQAAFGGPACAEFLKNGVILPNTQTLLPVLAADVAAAREELDKILSQQ